jgi:hypothetical protein
LFVSPFRPTHQNHRDPKNFIASSDEKKNFNIFFFIPNIHELGECI